MWFIFFTLVIILLILDLGVFHKKYQIIGMKQSLAMSGFYITIGLFFGVFIGYELGLNALSLYVTGFLVEKSLSLDNIFVISLIFSHLSIPSKYQHRVLFWGILGVILLRGLFIGTGSILIQKFHWILYFFAAFLIITGLKMLFVEKKERNLEEDNLLSFLKSYIPLKNEIKDHHFFVRDGKKWFATPLLLALIMVETADIVFAIDSIPAIFSLTQDPYIVYTSNIFAILGLRSLYFALAALLEKFYYLKHSLALILIFIGSKVYISDFFGLYNISPAASLIITIALLALGIIKSLFKRQY